jgi:CheY-like chemotaxis protein
LGIVEDNPEDFTTLVRLLRRVGCQRPLMRFMNGEEAIVSLRRLEAEGGQSSLPFLLLIDLNLPGRSGCQVIEEVKGDPLLRRIPIVVLSTSAHERDVGSCYEAGANSYMQKPMDLGRYEEVIRVLITYWLDVVLLPGKGQAV